VAEAVPLVLRRAIPDEAEALSALAIRSKTHWGYDAAFIAATRLDLDVSSDLIAQNACFVAMAEDAIVGFYLREGCELTRLFVAPDRLNRGIGRSLMEHMASEAKRAGLSMLQITSDPDASGFYEACGARQIGTAPSPEIPGRNLPVLELRLSDTPVGANHPS
jgi:GNAT superfamily N-acetyltransferase